MAQRIRDIAAAVVLGLATVTAWASADQDPAWELHVTINTNTTRSFETAKVRLFNDVDNLPNDTIRCVYSDTVVDLVQGPDGLRPDRSRGVQVEHTWASRAEWAHPDVHFNRASSVPGADLHHLYAVRQGLNGSRGDKEFGEPTRNIDPKRINRNGTLNRTGGGTATGSVRGQNDDGVTVWEPPDDHKGNVARAMFYMSVRYWWSIPDGMEAVLRRWHQSDPVDAAERARNQRIEGIQSNLNPFIVSPELVEAIPDY